MSIQTQDFCPRCVTDRVALRVYGAVPEVPQTVSVTLKGIEKVCIPFFEQGIIYKNYRMQGEMKDNKLVLQVELQKPTTYSKFYEILSP